MGTGCPLDSHLLGAKIKKRSESSKFSHVILCHDVKDYFLIHRRDDSVCVLYNQRIVRKYLEISEIIPTFAARKCTWLFRLSYCTIKGTDWRLSFEAAFVVTNLIKIKAMWIQKFRIQFLQGQVKMKEIVEEYSIIYIIYILYK